LWLVLDGRLLFLMLGNVLMKWRPFEYQGISYDLSHLHPFQWMCIQAAKGDKPERCYSFDVIFSLHTFTKGIESGAVADKSLEYCDSREVRVFDFGRYELSKQLPGIVKELGMRKCFHTGHNNFFTVELLGEAGEIRQYEIYFEVVKALKKQGGLRLFIQSAYERTRGHGSRPKKKPPIRFYVIAYNTMNNKMIKLPR